MKRKAENRQGAQGGVVVPGVEKVRQLLLGMVAGMSAAKQDLMQWVQELGMAALQEVFEADAVAIAGSKGEHRPERTYHRWGRTGTELPFGGRRIRVERPRVRSKAGKEVQLPSVERFKAEDPLSERVVNQVLLGISTRGYEQSLEAPPPGVSSRGTSKSAASRHLVERMGSKMREYFSRRLEDVSPLAEAVQKGKSIGGVLAGSKLSSWPWCAGTGSTRGAIGYRSRRTGSSASSRVRSS